MIDIDSHEEAGHDDTDVLNYSLIAPSKDIDEEAEAEIEADEKAEKGGDRPKQKRLRRRKKLCKTTFNIVLIGGSSTEKTSLLEATQEGCAKLYGEHICDMSECAAAVHLDELNKRFTTSFATTLPDESGLAYINALDIPYEFCTADFFVRVCDDPAGLSGDAQDVYSNMMLGDVFVVCYSMDDPGSLLTVGKFLELVSVSKEWDRDSGDLCAVVCMTKWDRRALVPHSSQNELLRNGEALARRWKVPHITTRNQPDAESPDFWVKKAIDRIITVRNSRRSGCCCCCYCCGEDDACCCFPCTLL